MPFAPAAMGTSALRLLGLLVALTASGCLDPLVGLECEQGLTRCGDQCVNLASSSTSCGACGQVCSGPCVAGMCSAARDGAGTDVDGMDAGANDAAPDGSAVDGAALPDAATDRALDAPWTDTPAADGAGDQAAVTPVDGAPDLVVADGPVPDAPEPDGPTPDVPPPLTCLPESAEIVCSNRCVNPLTDPDHCGGCGSRCGSGLCLAGECQARGAGHVVVIGHDYSVTRSGMNYLIGNAVFLSPGAPVRVLSYEGTANPQAVAGAVTAIQQVASETGRTWTRTAATADQVSTSLGTADVLLIHAQQSATDESLVSLGQAWGPALRSFVNSGKTVVLLEGAHAHQGTFQILREAMLFRATGRHEVTNMTMTVRTPSDAVATRVPRTYRAEMSSVEFDTVETSVVVDGVMRPVVLHLVF